MYWGEFRVNWQQMLAACVGIGFGSSIAHYTLSLFGPALLKEFGWTKAEFALIGSVPLATVFLVPFAGRFTDRFGTRLAAIIGFTALPLGFLAFTFMSGNIVEFFAIWIVQHLFAILTTSLVFCRIVVERFDTARGIALSVLMTSPPLIGALAPPLLGGVIEEHGWRAGYYALAAATTVGGLIAILTMGRDRRTARPARADVQLTRGEFFALFRSPMLLLILGGMLLVNIPQVFAQSQIKIVVLDRGVADWAATMMVSAYAIGVIVGRFLTGLALDRISANLVSAMVLGLPAIGYLVFASPTVSVALLTAAVAVIGLAQGAEGDIGAYLVSRRFELKVYSMLQSLVTAMIVVGSSVGSLVLSATLHGTDDFRPFLLIAAVATILGAALFAMTGGGSKRQAHAPLVEQAAAGELG